MKKLLKSIILFPLILLSFTSSAKAHFLVLLPDTDNIEGAKREVKLEARFTHPMEGGPNMEFKILDSGVLVRGEKINLNWERVLIPSMKGSSNRVSMYKTTLKITKPGVYQVYVDPEPYFEPSEKKYIKQITKVIIQALGMEEGWDEPIGLKAEIIPLIKPFALWEGNTFKGKVLINGEPASNIEVEVEYLNTKNLKAPYESFITQVVKTDENGYFEYTIPWAGWWGFSAIGEGGKVKGADGKEYPLELDAVIWVKAYPKPKEVK
jgi:cobalt/nickel transport protein